MLITPDAPLPGTATMVLSFFTIYEAASRFAKFTPFIHLKFSPIIVIGVPVVPAVGIKM
jgi:hypothetical protein